MEKEPLRRMARRARERRDKAMDEPPQGLGVDDGDSEAEGKKGGGYDRRPANRFPGRTPERMT